MVSYVVLCYQVSVCIWEADDLNYWIDICRLQLKSAKSPSCELQTVNTEFDAFNVSTVVVVVLAVVVVVVVLVVVPSHRAVICGLSMQSSTYSTSIRILVW